MAETTQFVSRISVKDLISAFENKSETVRVEFSRPRARSFGNVLSKNVVVRLNEFHTLEDVEKGLTKLETSLNFYEVYNKAKHVAFQEQFFNILTSIANIENDEEGAPVRKKRLISRTQTLVSFLNQKLPSNINQVVENKSNTQYNYRPYSNYGKEKPKVEQNNNENEEPSAAQPTLYVESNSSIDIAKSGEEYVVSVKKLKENFQQATEENNEVSVNTENEESTAVQPTLYVESNSNVDTSNSDEEYAVSVKKLKENFQQTTQESNEISITRERSFRVTQKVDTTVTTVQSSEQPKSGTKPVEENLIKENSTPKEEKAEAVSVMKLRSLFEQKSEEGPKGLEIITVEKSQLGKNVLGGSVQNVNIPYTERNLGTLRLQRSVSGNYMNYTGLLKRVDINRSSSNLDVNKADDVTKENTSHEDSDPESDDTLRNGNDRVANEEIRTTYSSITLDNQTEKKTSNSKGERIIATKEPIEISTYSSNTEREKGNNNIEINLSNGTATFVSENENQTNFDAENTSELQGFKEEEVKYSEASTDDIKHDEDDIATENELSFKGVDEIEINSGIAVSNNIQAEENVAEFEATTEDVQQSRTTLGNTKETEDNTNADSDLSFTSAEEIEVNQGIAGSQNIQVEESIAKLEATTEDAPKAEFIIANNNHVENAENNQSAFSSLCELEDERERSLIKEEIEKIDIDQTLANAELIVNSEDLKNADDDFEKLIENTETNKVIA